MRLSDTSPFNSWLLGAGRFLARAAPASRQRSPAVWTWSLAYRRHDLRHVEALEDQLRVRSPFAEGNGRPSHQVRSESTLHGLVYLSPPGAAEILKVGPGPLEVRKGTADVPMEWLSTGIPQANLSRPSSRAQDGSLATVPEVLFIAGGVTLRKADRMVLGGLGVPGDPGDDKDEVCAQKTVDKFRGEFHSCMPVGTYRPRLSIRHRTDS